MFGSFYAIVNRATQYLHTPAADCCASDKERRSGVKSKRQGGQEARKEGRKEAQIGTVPLPKAPVTFLFLHCEERGFGAVYASRGENEKVTQTRPGVDRGKWHAHTHTLSHTHTHSLSPYIHARAHAHTHAHSHRANTHQTNKQTKRRKKNRTSVSTTYRRWPRLVQCLRLKITMLSLSSHKTTNGRTTLRNEHVDWQ